MPPAPAAAWHRRAVPQPYAVPEPRAWPQPFVPPDRRDAAAGSLHSGHSSPWPPRSPLAHGYSCRQQTITMASGLPAGTACPFPSLCSQEAACTVRVPCAGPRWHLARPMALGGASKWSRGGVCPPCSTGATRHGRCGSGTGLGVVLGAPTLLQEMGSFVEAFAGAARAGGVGARRICTPLLTPGVLWGGEPGLGPPAGTTDPTNGGSLTRTGTAAPYPPRGLPMKTVGGCHAGQGAPPAPQLGAPWAELLGTALSPRVQEDPARRGRQRLGPPSWGHHWGDAVTFSMWQCWSHTGGY